MVTTLSRVDQLYTMLSRWKNKLMDVRQLYQVAVQQVAAQQVAARQVAAQRVAAQRAADRKGICLSQESIGVICICRRNQLNRQWMHFWALFPQVHRRSTQYPQAINSVNLTFSNY